jgi:hypothetical protein
MSILNNLPFKLTFIIVLTFSNSIFGQSNSFLKTIQTVNDQTVNDAVELPAGGFVLITSEAISNKSTVKLIKINNNGDTIKSSIVDEQFDISMIKSIIKRSDDTFWGIGSVSNSSLVDNNIWLLQFDNELNILKNIKYPVPYFIFSVSAIKDHFNNIIVNGWYNYTDYINTEDIFILRFSPDGDSLSYHHFNYPSTQISNTLMEKIDKTGYYMPMWGRFFSLNYYLSNMVELDYNFNITFEDSITNDLGRHNNIRKFNEQQYLLSGQIFPNTISDKNQLIAVEKLDKDYHAYNYQRVGPYLVDTVTYPAWVKNMDFVDTSNVFIGGTVNLAMYPNSNQNSYLILANLDSELNKQWQYFYGLDKYYELHGILATQDGGCLMLATYFNFTENEYERDIILIKVDSNGLITGINQKPEFEISNAIIYPNPGIEYFNVQSGPQISGAEFYLFDVNGKAIIVEKITNSLLNVNTAFLPSGTYTWQIVFKNKVIESGKWVKK